jgi:AraC family L-rhamnose operon transcriptional activator RhaR
MTHLQALAALRDRPLEQHRGDIIGRLALLFSELGRAVADDHRALVGEGSRAHPVVVRAMRLLEADLARHWTLTRLADELHTSPGYLVRLFKAATGLPPMAYLARVRVEHAAVLLLHSDEPITGIGQAVGWPDQNYFARRFKSHYGLSASAYRRRFATGARHLHHDASASEQVEDAVS